MKKILLVEPSEELSQIIKEYLERGGKLSVDAVHSSQAAIHAADVSKPDIVILELAMPMHNGFAFLHEFRSYQDWAAVPVIIHSHLARDEAAMSKSWKILGAVDYFYKPQTSLAQLRSSVEEVLEQ